MPPEKFELVTLNSGHTSLRHLSSRETFHPVVGPVIEAQKLHVDQQRLKQRCMASEEFVIWDVGLGAAANALTAITSLEDCPKKIEIHSFDRSLAPLQFALDHSEQLGYVAPWRSVLQRLIGEGSIQFGTIRWQLHLDDFRHCLESEDIPPPHSIFYDPYSAASNPEMWSLEHFQKLRGKLDNHRPCLLSNYTRSTAVRCTWLLAGFYVGTGIGVGDKDQTTVASNDLRILECPLPRSWLKQVAASQNANPLREGKISYGPISPEDLAKLEHHPQFLRTVI